MKTLLLSTISLIFCINLQAQATEMRIYSGGGVPWGKANETISIIIDVVAFTQVNGIIASKTENTILPGSSNYFCWGGTCESTTTTTSSKSIDLATGDTSSLTVYYNPNGNVGTSNLDYTFTATGSGNLSVTMDNIDFVASAPTSVNENASSSTLSGAYPNPSSGLTTISYSSVMDNNFLTIYDLAGKEIKKRKLTKGLGIVLIDVSEFENGIYLYTLSNENGIITTKKLVVTH